MVRFLPRALSVTMLVLLVALVGGCASTHATISTARFDPGAAAFIHAEGRAKISGQAFVRLSTGRLWRAVGTDVFLVPRTAYAAKRMAAIYGDGNKPKWGVRVADADPGYESHMRRTVASSGGSFSFDRVADGEYFVVAMIFIPGEFLGREFPIIERVSIKGGRSVRVVMRGY